MDRIWTHSFKTKWGTVRTAATERGLALVALQGEPLRSYSARLKKLGSSHPEKGGSINLTAQEQIEAYLDGHRTHFDLKLDLRGTPFQKKALQAVAAIPYGETRTYGEIAKTLGRPRAARAVGSANARNCLPLVIPCHRVVAAHGLGGYAGGLELKRKLLKLESRE